MPNLLWVGDAIASSGFAACSHAVCDHLHASGWQVSILGLNYFGDAHDYTYTIYPCIQPLDHGRDPMGITRLPSLIHRLKPDVVVILQDPWNIPEYLKELKKQLGKDYPLPPIVGWIAVDAKNQKGYELNGLDKVVVWTEFAKQELIVGGYDRILHKRSTIETAPEISIVPLGIDSDRFYVLQPEDKIAARKHVTQSLIPSDAFVVGFVGRNQPRKRLDLTIEYFAEWVHSKQIKDAYLYLHVGPTGDMGCDIDSLVRYHKINGRVVTAIPEIGYGVSPETMVEVYNSFDVFLTTCQGGGWELAVHESMACGVPCIVPQWSGLESWAKDATVQIPCYSTALSAPLNGNAWTIGGIPDKALTIEALDILYRDSKWCEYWSRMGWTRAHSLTWEDTGIKFRKVLEDVLGIEDHVPIITVEEIRDTVFNPPQFDLQKEEYQHGLS